MILAALLLAFALQPPAATPPAVAPPQTFANFMPPIVLSDPAPAGGVRIAEPGVLGNWFAPPAGGGRRPAILLLGGSEGGLGPGAMREAQMIAAEGYGVLQLAYFGAPGTPSALKLVPLETFDRGLAWLRARPEVDGRRLAVVGASKGAEAALLIASAHPELRAVVAAAPSSVVWNGIDFGSRDFSSSWSRGGAPLDYLQVAFAPPTPGGSMLQTIFSGYAEGLKGLPQHPAAAIPLERARARIMLVCGEADGLWPSCPMARMLKRRLPSLRVMSFPAAGHGVFGPPLPSGDPSFNALASLGGTAAANNDARKEAWPAALAFLRAALGGS